MTPVLATVAAKSGLLGKAACWAGRMGKRNLPTETPDLPRPPELWQNGPTHLALDRPAFTH